MMTMTDNTFPRTARVTSGEDFTAIIRRGPYAADDVVVVNVRWNDGDGQALPRLGITIPKKTGPAVTRNRWKRWIREAFRTQRERCPRGVDIIIRPKRDAVGSFEAIQRSLPKTIARAVNKLPPRNE
jgi:ribonuclease P protein component